MSNLLKSCLDSLRSNNLVALGSELEKTFVGKLRKTWKSIMFVVFSESLQKSALVVPQKLISPQLQYVARTVGDWSSVIAYRPL